MTEQTATVPAITAEEAREQVDRLVRFTFRGDLAKARAFVVACGEGADATVGQANVALCLAALDELARPEITDGEIAAVGEAMDGPRPASALDGITAESEALAVRLLADDLACCDHAEETDGRAHSGSCPTFDELAQEEELAGREA